MANYTTTGSDTFPAGHVVRTSYTTTYSHSGHISTTSDDPTATGVIVSSPATSGSNVNMIHLSSSGYIPANQRSTYMLYVSKNGGSYTRLWTPNYVQQQWGPHGPQSHHCSHDHTWMDTTGTSAGTNLYQIYFETASGTTYFVHGDNDYVLMVQEIKV